MHTRIIRRRVGSVSRQSGFSLIELMVTVAVLAIILGLAAPSFTNLMHQNRLTAAANEVVGALQTAKMEAIRRNTRVALCPSTTGTSCSGSDWSQFVIFVDGNSNGVLNAGETIVQNVEVTRAGAGISATGTANLIRFGPDGRVRVGAGAATQGAVSLVSNKLSASTNTRRVQVVASRVSVCNPSGTPTCS